MDVSEQGVSRVWTVFPVLSILAWFALCFWMTESRPTVNCSATMALTHACANIYMPHFASCRSNDICTGEIKFHWAWDYISEEMAFNVGLTCGQLEILALLLVCLTSSVVSCPQDCSCGQERDMVYFDCYDLSSMKSIPAGIPPATTTLWV